MFDTVAQRASYLAVHGATCGPIVTSDERFDVRERAKS